MNDIDNLAQSFFIVLIVCSLMNDSYVVVNNLFNNTYIKKKVNYSNKIYKIAKNMIFNNYEKDEKGNIIINDIEEKLKKNNIEINKSSNNPFDSDNESIDEENIEKVININTKKLINIEENKKKDEELKQDKNDSNKLNEIVTPTTFDKSIGTSYRKVLIESSEILHDAAPLELPNGVEVTMERMIPCKSSKISCDEEVKNIDIVITKKHKKNREKNIEEDIKEKKRKSKKDL
jgi:hypothetical protein